MPSSPRLLGERGEQRVHLVLEVREFGLVRLVQLDVLLLGDAPGDHLVGELNRRVDLGFGVLMQLLQLVDTVGEVVSSCTRLGTTRRESRDARVPASRQW